MILSIFFITISSFIFGMFFKILFFDYGPITAFGLFGLAFSLDYYSTIKIRDVKNYETSKLFQKFSKKFGIKTSLGLVGCTSVVLQLIIFMILNDLIITYSMAALHFYMVYNNFRVVKSVSKTTATS